MSNKKKIAIIIIFGFICLSVIIGAILLYIKQSNQIETNKSNKSNNEVDHTPPTITLNTDQNDSGVYYVTFTRGSNELKNIDLLSYIKEVSDDISTKDNIKVECNDTIDESLSTQYINYKVTDEAGNSSTTKLLVIINEDPEVAKKEKQEELNKMQKELDKLKEEEQARLEKEKKEREEREEKEKQEAASKNNNSDSSYESNTEQNTSAPEPETEAPKQNVYHNVQNFTIHDISELQSAALKYCSYGGCGGTLMANNFDISDTSVTIYWTCTCGWSGTSIATIQ